MNICLLSFDIEDWFQVENLRDVISRTAWDRYELRVVENTQRLLEILERHDTKATFFVLGWIADRVPQLVKEIHRAGHEIASHGYEHELIYKQPPEVFREDIHRSKSLLEDLTGEAVLGYRAPSFSITEYAIDILMEEGFRYDSSLFPSVYHDRYGKILSISQNEAKSVVRLRAGFYEVLISTLSFWGWQAPWGGGGYFRVLPYNIFRWGVDKILRKQGCYLFYLHPWEIDPQQPRIRGIKWNYRLRHYVGLNTAKVKLERLLSDFHFLPIRDGLAKLGCLSLK
ncbi:MAG: polysaccharide deacetylase family protein [Candidatus Alkanophagales archaeon]|nr:MAG: polysaccharide deacetylase family protein [Candidatus Alkanophagales archaeon]